MIKSIYVESIGNIEVGSPSMGERRYEKIFYEPNIEMYQCFLDGKIVEAFNKRYVVMVSYFDDEA